MTAPCGACGAMLEPARYAICAVCEQGGAPLRLCVACARGHFCTARCRTNGCKAGLCTKLVTNGTVARAFGAV